MLTARKLRLELCEELAVKIERRDSLSQKDYRAMIAQNEAILIYLIEQSKKISEEPAPDRSGSWRQLLADPEYMERFSNIVYARLGSLSGRCRRSP